MRCSCASSSPVSQCRTPAESFIGRLRDECLSEHWFGNLLEARLLIEDCRQRYNDRRPHSSLGYQTPAAFARPFAVAA